MRVPAIATFLSVLVCSGCGGAGSGVVTPHAPSATAAPQPATSGIAVSITVPSSTAAQAARRAISAQRTPSYISVASSSVTFTLDEPDIAQADLRHRTVVKPMSPGVNTFVLDTPEGTVTLSASITNATFGELSFAAPMTVTVTQGQSTPLSLTFRPIVTQAWLQLIGNPDVFTMLLNPGPPIQECVGVQGQVALTGLDPAGNVVSGVGNFLDTMHNDVTLTIAGGFIGGPFQTDFTAGGVNAFVGGGTNAASALSAGSYVQTLLNFASRDPALKASASSPLVLPTVVDLWDPGNGPQCVVSSLG